MPPAEGTFKISVDGARARVDLVTGCIREHASNTVGSIPAPLDAAHVHLSTNSDFTVLFHDCI
jgi:hypothetical protein